MQKRLSKPEIKYSYGPYNKYNDNEQWIRITEGCPHDFRRRCRVHNLIVKRGIYPELNNIQFKNEVRK